ncbi:MAG TPA: deoxynucleoside kinase [Clostridiales bacterium]|nr:deoxynucleoside kinase [Clostridiales bacterium]HQP70840.1 deoxynucleoside kinase [Clostridiales bacterium]
MKFNLNQIYIAVEGATGSGKNQLAKKLSEKLSANLINDKGYFQNPFLADFYQNPEKFALPLQLFFLTMRYQQQVEIPFGDLFRNNIVANYIFNKDQIYASYNLDDKNFTLYNQILKVMNPNIHTPDLVIYLHAPDPAMLFDNIRKRKRVFEKEINEAYIEGLNKGYIYFFDHFRECPLLIVNIDGLNPDNKEHIKLILKEIENGIDDSKYLKI